MAKLIPLYDELIFLDVLPELHSDFIERIKNKRKNKKQWLHHTLSPSIPSSVPSPSPVSLLATLSPAKSFPIQNLKITGTPMNKAKSTKYTESQRNHGKKGQGTTVKTRWCLCLRVFWRIMMGNVKYGVFPFYSVLFGSCFPIVSPDVSP